MIKIDSNQTIRLSRGDDVQLPLFINFGTPTAPVRYSFVENQGEWIELYIFELNDNDSVSPILTKVFKDNGEIITIINDIQTTQTGMNNINDNGDMIVRFASSDSLALSAGEYRYQLKARLIDSEEDTTTYKHVTITNKLTIHLIGDDYSDRVWGN